MRSRFEITDEEISEIYDLLWGQLKEDREIVLELYKELKALVKDNPERYAISGDTLAKFGDLLLKQTVQVQELLKIAQKQKNEERAITEHDLEKIAEEINKQ